MTPAPQPQTFRNNATVVTDINGSPVSTTSNTVVSQKANPETPETIETTAEIATETIDQTVIDDVVGPTKTRTTKAKTSAK